MFRGWATMGGVELWNAARTEAYTKELAPGFTLRDCTDCDDLAFALGDDPYKLPILDEPTWFDPDNPDTYNFAGFYPLEIAGANNANREVEVLESIGDGGVIGPVRLTTKEMVVRGILVAGDPCALQAGIEWFKYVLNGNVCADNCDGDNLCFLYCCPDVSDGMVDPESLAVPHPISLSQTHWTVDSGRWIEGQWTPSNSPSTAIGPLFAPPCDETIIQVTFALPEDQSIILSSVGEDDGLITTTDEVLLRRTNYARNPTFRVDTKSWAAQANTTLAKEPNNDAGILTTTGSIAQNDDLVQFSGINQVFANQTYSLRVTAELVTPGSACLSLDLGTVAGGTVNRVQGTNYSLTSGTPVELEITGATVQDPGALVGVVRACGPIPANAEIRLSKAIITETRDQADYFDGDTQVDGYDVFWKSTPNNGYSIMEISNKQLLLEVPDGSGPYHPELTALETSEVHVQEVVIWARETLDPGECVQRNYLRQFRDVVVTEGPEILTTIEECDHAIAEVEFTITAANPYMWHVLPLEAHLVDDSQPQPLPPGTLRPQRWPPVTHFPPGIVGGNDDCPPDATQGLPLSDPNCPQPPAPPRPPQPDDCLEDPNIYIRRSIGIPGDLFSQWQQAVPIIELTTESSTAVRQARIRFYPNPLERDDMDDIDLCGYCGEFIISYMPGNSTMIIDGMTERARVVMPGEVVKEATHLLYGSDGGPMQWPILTCGTPYIMSVDIAPTYADVVASSMQIAVRS